MTELLLAQVGTKYFYRNVLYEMTVLLEDNEVSILNRYPVFRFSMVIDSLINDFDHGVLTNQHFKKYYLDELYGDFLRLAIALSFNEMTGELNDYFNLMFENE
jgi:hypothetical protein